MPQDNSTSHYRKLAWIAPASIAVALLLVVAGGLLLFGGRQPQPEPVPALVPQPALEAPTPPPSVAEAPVTRMDLVKAGEEAMAAFADQAIGTATAKDALVGRKFAIRIPFGCEGPQGGAGTAQAFYEFDPEQRSVHLVARPGDWTNLPMMQSLQDSDVEAVEGFWVPRPWRYADTCPQRRQQPVPAAPTPPATPTLGLAQLFKAGGSRVVRHAARPYERVVKLE
jgi:hypothetical protein